MLKSENIIDVDTGEVRVSAEPALLQSVALGSCIGLTAYDHNLKIGGLAHIMLPGKSPFPNHPTKYAENAIESLMDSVTQLGVNRENLEICIVGGANILQEGDIPDKVLKSVLKYLKGLNLKLTYMRVGGVERRSVTLDTTSGQVFYTEGDNSTKILLKEYEKIQFHRKIYDGR